MQPLGETSAAGLTGRRRMLSMGTGQPAAVEEGTVRGDELLLGLNLPCRSMIPCTKDLRGAVDLIETNTRSLQRCTLQIRRFAAVSSLNRSRRPRSAQALPLHNEMPIQIDCLGCIVEIDICFRFVLDIDLRHGTLYYPPRADHMA